MTYRLLASTAALALLTLSGTAHAAITFNTADVTFTMLGDEIGSDFDKITLKGVPGSYTGYGTYTLNHVIFDVAVNANTIHTVTGSFANTGTSSIGPFAYSVPYTLNISFSDTITLGGNSYTAGGTKFTINPLTLNSGIGTVAGDLTFTASAIPEPAAWGLMIAGLGLVGSAVRRRKSARMVYA